MKFHDDTNSLIAALLRDLAAVQPLQRSGWGYKRAANAVLALDVPIESLVQADGSLGSRSRVVAALNDPSLVGPTLADYHGDLQMHSVWSDGSQTLEQIIETGLARGYDYCGVTDHSYGLPIAGGLSMAELAEQQREVDRLNRTYRDHFCLIKGIEANIRADGSVDMTPEELASLELVVAAPHSVLRSSEDQTSRMIAAVSTPGVHILGHPRGRMYGSRAGVSAMWDAVFAVAAVGARGRSSRRSS